jgi:hypothetical protein
MSWRQLVQEACKRIPGWAGRVSQNRVWIAASHRVRGARFLSALPSIGSIMPTHSGWVTPISREGGAAVRQLGPPRRRAAVGQNWTYGPSWGVGACVKPAQHLVEGEAKGPPGLLAHGGALRRAMLGRVGKLVLHTSFPHRFQTGAPAPKPNVHAPASVLRAEPLRARGGWPGAELPALILRAPTQQLRETRHRALVQGPQLSNTKTMSKSTPHTHKRYGAAHILLHAGLCPAPALATTLALLTGGGSPDLRLKPLQGGLRPADF